MRPDPGKSSDGRPEASGWAAGGPPPALRSTPAAVGWRPIRQMPSSGLTQRGLGSDGAQVAAAATPPAPDDQAAVILRVWQLDLLERQLHCLSPEVAARVIPTTSAPEFDRVHQSQMR